MSNDLKRLLVTVVAAVMFIATGGALSVVSARAGGATARTGAQRVLFASPACSLVDNTAAARPCRSR